MIAGIREWLGATLARKFILLLAVFLALQVLQLGLGVLQVQHVSEEAELLSGVGKIRPLLLAELGHRALVAGKAQSRSREAFHERLALHDRIYRRLREEYAPQKGDEHYSRLAGLAVEACDAWEREFRPLLLAVDTAQPRAAAVALARFEDLAPAQVERIARLVGLLEQEVELETRRALRNHALIFVLSMLLVLSAIWFVRRHVTHPLRRFIETSQAVAAGAYDRHVPISSRDELGELAETLNRMADAIGEKTTRLTALNETAVAIVSSPNLQETLNAIMRYGASLTGSKAACIAFYDQETQRFKEWVTLGLSEHFVQNMTFRPGGLADEAFTTAAAAGTYVLSNDRPETKHKLSRLTHEEGIRSFICLPLTSHASRLGVIYFYRTDRDTFTADEIDLLRTFSNLAAGAIEEAKLRDSLAGLARTDALTGLANRREFDARLLGEHARAQRYSKPYAFMMLDIDRFKEINDTHGHIAGDGVLKALAVLICKQLRDADVPVRYGGEEFAVILPETGGGAAKKVAERVRHAVAVTPFRLPDGREIGISVSIGVSCYPNCAQSPQEVVQRADQALYVAKEAGRNRVVLYREMLKKLIDEDPSRIVALLNESLNNVQPLVTSISAKAPFFRGHTRAVEQIALRLARALGLAAADIKALRQASRLHDIGMAVVPDAILNKTTELSGEEGAQVRRHPAVAAGWLEQVPALKHLAPLVRHHHERYDGSGYPDGLRGENTPYLARVLAVADAYASMIARWPGHEAMKPETARAVLRAGAGAQFDPQIVQALLRALDEQADQAARSNANA